MSQENLNINCNICDQNSGKELHVIRNFRIVRCPHCGLIYMNPRPVWDKQHEIYTNQDYSRGYIAKKESKRRRARKILRGIVRYKKSGRFLDVGCSAGFILEAARAQGFDTYGIEISPAGIKHAKEELKLNVFPGFLEDAHYPDAYFDVITMYHVIEHVPDPLKIFKEIRRVIKPDGLLEVWTPNVGHRDVLFFGPKWKNFIKDHFYFFDVGTIGKMLDKVGMRVLKNQFTLKDGLKVYAKVKNA